MMINRRRFLNITGRTMLGAGLANFLPRQLVAADNGFSDYKCLVIFFSMAVRFVQFGCSLPAMLSTTFMPPRGRIWRSSN